MKYILTLSLLVFIGCKKHEQKAPVAKESAEDAVVETHSAPAEYIQRAKNLDKAVNERNSKLDRAMPSGDE